MNGNQSKTNYTILEAHHEQTIPVQFGLACRGVREVWFGYVWDEGGEYNWVYVENDVMIYTMDTHLTIFCMIDQNEQQVRTN